MNIRLQTLFLPNNILTQLTMVRDNVCPALVNGRLCSERTWGCPFSHEMADIRWWWENNGKKPCQHGKRCTYLLTNTCIFFHQQGHQRRIKAWRDEREAEVHLGLEYREHLDLEALNTPAEPVGITSVEYLASFNKVSDGEIAVPGSLPTPNSARKPVFHMHSL